MFHFNIAKGLDAQRAAPLRKEKIEKYAERYE